MLNHLILFRSVMLPRNGSSDPKHAVQHADRTLEVSTPPALEERRLPNQVHEGRLFAAKRLPPGRPSRVRS